MRGVTSAIRFNHEGWMKSFKGEMVCVDGLQRITALLRFLHQEIPAFGHKLKDYEDQHFLRRITISIKINDLSNKKEVISWYLDLNSGGTPHTKEELDRAKLLRESL